jgi:hypothetical protein
MSEYLDSHKRIYSMIEFPVPKFMSNNRNYLILIVTLKTRKVNVNFNIILSEKGDSVQH